MRLLVRASTIRAPTTTPAQPRVYGIGRQGTRASATAAAPVGSEAIGRQGTRASAQPLLVRPALQGTRATAQPLIRGLGRQGTRATATASIAIGYGYDTALVAERNEDLTAATPSNYVLRLHLTQTWLKSVANGGHVQSATAYDLTFETTAAVRYDHEIESYDGATGDMWVALRIPSWAVVTDQIIIRAKYGASL